MPSQSFGRSQQRPVAEQAPTQQRPASGRGNSFLQDQLRVQAPQCTADGPVGDYVTMEAGGKAEYLAELFQTPGVQSTFGKRGFNPRDQSQLAAIMQNEGGTTSAGACSGPTMRPPRDGSLRS